MKFLFQNYKSVIDAVTKLVLETSEVGNYPVGAWPGMGGTMYMDNEKDQSIRTRCEIIRRETFCSIQV